MAAPTIGYVLGPGNRELDTQRYRLEVDSRAQQREMPVELPRSPTREKGRKNDLEIEEALSSEP